MKSLGVLIGILVGGVLAAAHCRAEVLTLPKVQTSQTKSVVRVNPSTTKEYPPGIYETAPYTGAVIVPSSHFDQKMIIASKASSKAAVPSMPKVTPELRLIPRGTGK